MVRRRRFVATLGAGVLGSLAGCGSDSSSSTDEPSTDEPPTDARGRTTTEPTDEPPETTTESDPDPAGPATTATWPTTRGTAAATGASSSGGPGTDATRATTVEFRDGRAGGNTAPVVGDDGVYEVTTREAPYSDDPPVFRLYAHAHSNDGAERWRTTVVEAEGEGGFETVGSEHTGALGPDHLYAVRAYQPEGASARSVEVTALARADGSRRWRRTFDRGFQARQPVVHDGTLYLFAGAELLALSTADGSVRWRRSVAASQRFPVVGEGAVAVYNRGLSDPYDVPGQLTVFDAADGSERWTEPFPQARTGRGPIPTVAGGAVYLTDGDSIGQYDLGPEDLPRRKLYARDLADGSELWTHTYETDTMHEHITAGGTASVTVAGDHLYYALAFADGAEVLGPNATEEDLERVQQELYRGPNLFALDRRDGSVIWETKLGEQAQVFQPMIVDEQYLYGRYDGVETLAERPEIRVIDRGDGTVVGSFGPVESRRPFAVAGGDLYVHHNDSVRVWR
jgi:outer membrane protein assembly factor BamB